jgi:hypothetical protein
VAIEADGDWLNKDELLAMKAILLSAGHEAPIVAASGAPVETTVCLLLAGLRETGCTFKYAKSPTKQQTSAMIATISIREIRLRVSDRVCGV